MSSKMYGLRWWYKEYSHAQFSEDYWRIKLIQHTLLLSCLVFPVLSIINAFGFKNVQLALMDFFAFALTLAIYFAFRKSGNVKFTAWLISIAVTGVMLYFLISVEGRAYSLVWATVILPFTFFLLGRRGGAALSTITLCVCIYLVSEQASSGIPITISTGAILNVTEAAIVQLLLFRFYEGTRQQAFDQLRAEHKVSKELSETDHLTGVYNRAKFLSLVKTAMATNNAGNHSLVILDIDDFKKINDELGHNEGDNVLKAFTRMLRESTREEDVIARWGGEEFVLLLQNVSAVQAKARLDQLVTMKQCITPLNTPVLFSAGIVQCKRGEVIDELIRVADEALYQAKHDGKARVYIAA